MDFPDKKKSNVRLLFKATDPDWTLTFLKNNSVEFKRTNERNAEAITTFDPDGNELLFVKEL